jgi:hypothetical protein
MAKFKKAKTKGQIISRSFFSPEFLYTEIYKPTSPLYFRPSSFPKKLINQNKRKVELKARAEE